MKSWRFHFFIFELVHRRHVFNQNPFQDASSVNFCPYWFASFACFELRATGDTLSVFVNADIILCRQGINKCAFCDYIGIILWLCFTSICLQLLTKIVEIKQNYLRKISTKNQISRLLIVQVTKIAFVNLFGITLYDINEATHCLMKLCVCQVEKLAKLLDKMQFR